MRKVRFYLVNLDKRTAELTTDRPNELRQLQTAIKAVNDLADHRVMDIVTNECPTYWVNECLQWHPSTEQITDYIPE